MVTVLPARESFGSAFSKALTGAFKSAGEGYAERQKVEGRKKLIEDIENPSQKMGQDLKGANQPQDIRQKFIEALPMLEQMKREQTGEDLTPQDLDQAWAMINQAQKLQAQQPQHMPSQEEDPFLKAKKYAAAGEDQLARLETERAKAGIKERTEDKKLKQQKELAERKEAHGLALPTLERGRELIQDLPYKENALMAVKDAIESGNLGMFSLDNLAEMTGIEGLRSPEGTTFKTASKEFFLGNISRVGAKGLNQMMEKIVYEMGPQIGRSTEANLSVSEILGAENDVTRKEAELIHDIGSSYKEKHGHYPEDLSYRVDKELTPYAHQRQKDALAEVEKIKQRYQPKNKEGLLMYDPAGNLRRVPFNNKKEALKEGYRMP